MPRDTGFPRADVENDFLRIRRRQVLSRLARWLSREPDDVNLILPFDEVVAALGYEGERFQGLKTIDVGSIVGTTDSRRDFDRRFRPTSTRVRERWERVALAQRRGEAVPPIDVYRVGHLYFVRDGHHRVSIAMANGQPTIEAYVVNAGRKLTPFHRLKTDPLPGPPTSLRGQSSMGFTSSVVRRLRSRPPERWGRVDSATPARRRR